MTLMAVLSLLVYGYSDVSTLVGLFNAEASLFFFASNYVSSA